MNNLLEKIENLKEKMRQEYILLTSHMKTVLLEEKT